MGSQSERPNNNEHGFKNTQDTSGHKKFQETQRTKKNTNYKKRFRNAVVNS